MSCSNTLSVPQWQVPVPETSLQIDPTQFPQLTNNSIEIETVKTKQKTKKLESTSKTRPTSSYASLFKHDANSKSHVFEQSIGNIANRSAEDETVNNRNKHLQHNTAIQESSYPVQPNFIQTLPTTNQPQINKTTVPSAPIAPAIFYKNVPPPPLAMQQPMYATLPVVTAAAEVTTPCGEKLYIPLDRNKYELKRGDDNPDDHPKLLGANVFQKESEMDGYEHSPRPVMYRGSISDEDVSESDNTSDASKSSSNTSTATSESKDQEFAKNIHNNNLSNTTYLKEECIISNESIIGSTVLDSKTHLEKPAREVLLNTKVPDTHSYMKQRKAKKSTSTNTECTNSDLKLTNSKQEETQIDINEIIKTMANQYVSNTLQELSKNGNASGDSEPNVMTEEMKNAETANEPKLSTEIVYIVEDKSSIQVPSDAQNSTIPDIQQGMVYTQAQMQQQMPQYTQGINNTMVYYQDWGYAPQADNTAQIVYSQYSAPDTQYGAAPYVQYGYTDYSSYPDMVGYNGMDYMTGYSEIAWSVPQMESPLQETYHFNDEVWNQQENVKPPDEGTLIVNDPYIQNSEAADTTHTDAATGLPDIPDESSDFPAEIPPENHADTSSDIPPGIHTGLPAHIITDASIPKDPPLFPALHVSDDGLVTVILRQGVFLEMTADRDLRLVCHDRKLVAAMNNDGTCACLIHPAAKVHQRATSVDVELYLSRKVKIMTENTVFGNNFDNYVFDYHKIERKPDSPNYLDQSDDKSVGFLNTDTGFFNLDVALRTSEIVRRAYFEVYQTNGSKVILNGVKIVQTDNGDVTVYSGPIKYLRLSPLKNILRLRSQFLDADIETNWNVKLRRGAHTLNASYLGLILSNGNIKACLDQNNKLQAFELPDHKRLTLGQRLQEKRPGVPNNTYIDVTERRSEPEGDHWGYPIQHGV